MGRGVDVFLTLLGDLYFVFDFPLDPVMFGWCTSRPRLFVILILRSFANTKLGGVLGPLNHTALANRELLKKTYAFDELLALLKRPCGFSYHGYFIADDEELQRELEWAAARPGVRGRHVGQMTAEEAQKIRMFVVADTPGSFVYCLTAKERLRLGKYRALAGVGKCFDLAQEPVHRPCADRGQGNLPTLTAHMGIILRMVWAGGCHHPSWLLHKGFQLQLHCKMRYVEHVAGLDIRSQLHPLAPGTASALSSAMAYTWATMARSFC